jgi:hypothetical protein
MLCDDLSICTTTSARAGVSANPDMTRAAANARLASHPPDSRFMTLALQPDFCWWHDVVFGSPL